MKKTLITLAALAMASVASAADITSSTGFFAGEDAEEMPTFTSAGSYASAYTFSFTISCDIAEDKVVAGYWGPSYAVPDGAHAFVIDADTMSLQVGLGRFGTQNNLSMSQHDNWSTWSWTSLGNNSSEYPRIGTFGSTTDGEFTATTLQVGVEYTVTLTSNKQNEQVATLSWVDSENVAHSATAKYDGIMNGSYTEGSWNGAGWVVTKVVPEPATATLSLLALAGLAARRRRK